jgi:hypothetical protein
MKYIQDAIYRRTFGFGEPQVGRRRGNQACYDTEPNWARRGSVNSGEMVEVKPTAVDATAILLW